MNYKLEKFWNACIDTGGHHTQKWTINLKSFEIIYKNGGYMKVKFMNCKLEKFWNISPFVNILACSLWTVNLKSFEIEVKRYFRN